MSGARRAASQAVRSVIEHARGFDVEIMTVSSDTGLTRFAGSTIIQNTARRERRAYVRVVSGLKTATVSTTRLDEGALRAATESALSAAEASVEDPEFPGLPHPDIVGTPDTLERFDESTAHCPPAQRAAAVDALVQSAGPGDTAGYVETSAHRFEITSSTGIDCADGYTRCAAQCLIDTGEATGWAEGYSFALGRVDVAALAAEARRKVERGRVRVGIDPGTYPVVLEPSAVATVLEYLGYSGFGAKQLLDGESFLATRTGDQVAAPSVDVVDDVYHPIAIGLPFDLEGVPRGRVALLENGVARGPVTDLRTARRLQTTPTGHYSGSPEVGPYASNLVMAPGAASTEELIAGIDDGLLVTRFHYVNILDRPSALLTGMTRDGTFRIVQGEVAEPVNNLRFTQSALDALSAVEDVGAEQRAFAESFGSTVAPALRVSAFHFSSTTTH